MIDLLLSVQKGVLGIFCMKALLKPWSQDLTF